MSRMHENLTRRDFVKPVSIVTAEVCTKSGKLENPGVCSHDPRGSMLITEYFAAGTEPKETCDHHASVSLCSVSGMPAGPYCPSRYAGVRIIGGSSDSEDGPYLYSGNIYRTCTLHASGYQAPVDDTTSEDENTEDETTVDEEESPGTVEDDIFVHDSEEEEGEENGSENL
mgnify:CR=1 FL=1